jgi:hypothetical protein
MDISNVMANEGADIFYLSAFRDVLEDHVSLLRDDSTTEVIDVKPEVGYKFEYDLCGFLASVNVPAYLHWITMRVNGWHSESDFYNPQRILVPHRNSINKIKHMYEASTTK